MSSLIVNENDSLNTIVRAFSEQSSCSGVFVVDKKGRYRGVITRADLLNWARFKLGVGIRSERFISLRDVRRYVFSTTAREIIHRHSYDAYVKPDDDLIKALDLMVSMDVIDIPVVDEQGRILGDLKLSDVLNKISRTRD
ncbi:CBS domain-containing protein [Candidatus Bathyarchaeota archaeon]|nr:CBS domain-containing protein [Candidatus Bathyarchaeota archaeon]